MYVVCVCMCVHMCVCMCACMCVQKDGVLRDMATAFELVEDAVYH